MGEGLFRRRDAVTCYAEPYEHLCVETHCQDDWDEAYQDFKGRVRQAAGPSFYNVRSEWGTDGDRIILRNGLFKITLYQDSYARIHVTYAVSKLVDGLPEENFAEARLASCAKGFFDGMQETDHLRVRDSAWTSKARVS
jgi:hypothetical protein